MLATAAGLLSAPADSARAVAQVYTLSLLATVPLAAAAGGALLLRHAPAATRALVWRAAVVALLVVCMERVLPLQWMAWVVPAGLASPLVALGRMQLIATHASAPVLALPGQFAGTAAPSGTVLLVHGIAIVYWAGVVLVCAPLFTGWCAARIAGRRARVAGDANWTALLADASAVIGVTRRIQLRIADAAPVPVTWGAIHPVVLLPAQATAWNDTRRRAVLLHELQHVRSGDVAFALAARLVCALLWFHPGAWWVARRLRDECELACDDRVLRAGIRASEYAELLASSAIATRPARGLAPVAMALAQRGGLRGRLAAIVTRHDTRAPARRTVALAGALTISLAVPLGLVQLLPTRGVLTGLMRDTRWESRAYAVMGLAQRADSVAVARVAATSDPSPRVRAWAVIALARDGAAASPASRR